MTLSIWHNPRCSKSRQTLQLLRDQGHEPAVVLYLTDAPTASEIREVLGLLGMSPRQLMRRGEAVYKELGLAGVEDDEALLAAMAENPKLIERPVVIRGGAARIGRPPEKVLELWD
jgi:arsenate reductase (glutaredoxin)